MAALVLFIKSAPELDPNEGEGLDRVQGVGGRQRLEVVDLIREWNWRLPL